MKKFLQAIIGVFMCMLCLIVFVACGDSNSKEIPDKLDNTSANMNDETNEDNIDNEFVFTEFNNNTCELSKYIGDSSKVTIPSSYKGIPVTSIGMGAFFNCNNVKQLIIPDCVTAVSNTAFENCMNIEQVEMPIAAVYAIPQNNLIKVLY